MPPPPGNQSGRCEMIYYTGDLHGDVSRVVEWIRSVKESEKESRNQEVYLIQMGDAGLNYYLDERDCALKGRLQDAINAAGEKGIRIRILFIKGNHDCRPGMVKGYRLKDFGGSQAWAEEKFPDLIFLRDGQIYQVEGKRFLVIGGGYSADFFMRILRGEGYWFDEQLREEEFWKIRKELQSVKYPIYVLSHMLPFYMAPWRKEKELLFTRETRTELWLQTISCQIEEHVVKWIAGHYHFNRIIPDSPYEVIYDRIKKLE